MTLDTKLRSFQVENLAKYEKFREIQHSRNKKIGQRLNELIEKEVKEADPHFKDMTAVRTRPIEQSITPNPFVMDQFHSLPLWEEYLKTLTQKQHSALYLHLIALKTVTRDFEDFRLE